VILLFYTSGKCDLLKKYYAHYGGWGGAYESATKKGVNHGQRCRIHRARGARTPTFTSGWARGDRE